MALKFTQIGFLFCVASLLVWDPGNGAPIEDCPPEYGDVIPVLIVSVDGFRADYLQRDISPSIQELADTGVTASYMISSYPTLTFPNHYSIITGTYPEHHGIIANNFYDPDFHETFHYSSYTSQEGKWWGAEPVWNTVTRQGKKSATFFWPGSDADIGGKRPTYWKPFNMTIPFEDRVDQVLEWIQMPVEERPSFISLYVSEPDHTGHGSGPESLDENDQIMRVDLMIKRLIDGIREAGLLSCINIIVVSDHGMAPSGEDYIIRLEDYIPNIREEAYSFPGAFTRIDPKDDSEEVKEDMIEKLSCKRQEMRVFAMEDLPTRFHFSNNHRIEPIVLDLDPGYTGNVHSDFYLYGEHGYDFYSPLMKALFIAHGPAFKENLKIDPFQNTELYNLLCHLAGVDPAPNNGTEGSLYHILAQSPEPPVFPEEDPPPNASFPEGDLQPLLKMSGCDGDLQYPEDWLQSFNLSTTEEETLRAHHFPWGIPHSGDLPADLILLHNQDHVTAYSTSLQMPLWSSFSVDDLPIGTGPALWSSDIRLTSDTTITCQDYETLPENFTMYPLFPPELSQTEYLERVPYMVSNAVPMNIHQMHKWDYLINELLPTWKITQGPLNVIVGPLFDNNADSLTDDFKEFSKPEIPSDFFAVVTRCKDYVPSIDKCSNSTLDALTFIIPVQEQTSNCLETLQYYLTYSGNVQDVELGTSLIFYPDLPFEDRTSITLRRNPELWPLM